jgi:hypothetical protein
MQARNTQAGRIDDASCLKIANKYIVKTIIFSIFNNIDLSRSMLASGGPGGRAQWRPSGNGGHHDWDVFFYLASA